jgi:hypothetical protein
MACWLAGILLAARSVEIFGEMRTAGDDHDGPVWMGACDVLAALKLVSLGDLMGDSARARYRRFPRL